MSEIMDYDYEMMGDEMKIDPRLAGARCIGQIRCSRREQSKKSLPQQQTWLRTFADMNKSKYVADMKEAVSASQTRKRPDLDRIFERKLILNDFDTVLVQDLSRLTRGGAEHGLEIYFKLKGLGIRLASIADGLIDGDQKVIDAAQKFQEARAMAKATARNTRRGVLSARKKGRLGYSFNPPYAVDRLIVTEAREPLFRLRSLPDGSQLKLSVDGQTVLHHYPPNIIGEQRRHKKQAHEFESYAPGAPQDVSLVNRIYNDFYIKGFAVYHITKSLNDECQISAKGKGWNTASVSNVIGNPIYLNMAIGDRTSVGEFFKNGPSYPLPALSKEGILAKYAPESDWHYEKHPAMEEFLSFDELTKASIYAKQLAEARRKALKQGKKRGGTRHLQSNFLLSGILRDKLSGIKFIGLAKRTRRYGMSRARYNPRTDNPLYKSYSAAALEEPFRPLVRSILDSYKDITSVAQSVAEEYYSSAKTFADELPSLRAERNKLLNQIDFWVKQLGNLDFDFVSTRTQPLQEAVVAVGTKIAFIEEQKNCQNRFDAPDASNLDVCLRNLSEIWDSLSNGSIKLVLKILVHRLVIDIQTNEVELELRLPSWVAMKPNLMMGGLEKGVLEYAFYEAPSQWAVPLGKWRFLYRPKMRGGMLCLPANPDTASTASAA